MSLATTTDTAAITPAPLSKYEIMRNERHHADQPATYLPLPRRHQSPDGSSP
jgi:hypothetical protein